MTRNSELTEFERRWNERLGLHQLLGTRARPWIDRRVVLGELTLGDPDQMVWRQTPVGTLSRMERDGELVRTREFVAVTALGQAIESGLVTAG